MALPAPTCSTATAVTGCCEAALTMRSAEKVAMTRGTATPATKPCVTASHGCSRQASASRQMQRQALSDEERAFVTEFLIFLIVDILFCATGALIFWVLTLGKCKINFPERSTPIYWGFSFIGFVAWALILFFILIGLGD
jgi:hypothetical protein